MCCSNVLLRCSLPCPIIDVALESWVTPLKLGLPSSLRVNSPVPLSTLVTAMVSLILPSSGSLLSWTRVIALTFIRHDNSETFKILLRTTGHDLRELMNMPVNSFYEVFNFKSLRLNITCSCFLQNTHVTIELLSSRHRRIVVQPFTNTSRWDRGSTILFLSPHCSTLASDCSVLLSSPPVA